MCLCGTALGDPACEVLIESCEEVVDAGWWGTGAGLAHTWAAITSDVVDDVVGVVVVPQCTQS